MSRKKLPNGACHTLATIAERCIEEGDCLLWQGATSTPAKPVLQMGRKLIPVRRYIFTELMGKKITGKNVVSFTCQNELCVHEDHIAQMSRSEVIRRSVERTNYNLCRSRSAKLSMAARSRSPHSDELVEQVRSEVGSYQQIADRLGLKKSFIGDIRSQRHRKPTTPFTGLGARPAANDPTTRKRA